MRSDRPLESRTGGRAATTGVIPGDIAISVGNPNSPLPVGWEWRLLTDLARLETGHTPSRRHPEYWGGSVPWVGIRDATGNHGGTIYETAQYTNELGIRNSSARVLPANTVCLSRTASVGYVVVMGVPMATSQDFVNWVCGPDLDYRYLKYVLLGERRSFLRFASGTTHQTIYFPEVKAFHIALPPREVQVSIADILGALDDRINLLRQTNTTLESIAQALFKSWFIDFDPVRAKQAGGKPEGMDAAMAALFPAEFEESALGLIPKGWSVLPFSETVDIVGGGTPKTSVPEYWDGDIPWFSVVDAPAAGQVFTVATEKSVTKLGVDNSSTRILPMWTTIISARGTVGKLALTGVEMAMNQSCYGLRPRASGGETTTYLAAQRLVEDLKRLAHGGVFDTITRDTLNSVLVCNPPSEIIKAFDALTRPLFERILANGLQSRSLTETRDTLLPRLISGKLRLPEAQEQLEDALA
ncbi:restriction endonuclease subunit S [Thiobacillus sedimenti]|uniref:Restriction endonuclease subunit S n=1 Tax=Thiobacillus sedimenti TaxID=3110231 RepID=A0ABZ1CNX4_9PROT|nr:restriction endonuclease subunit S [Thiobacillus sp. SCUT-2]WRS40600.1 restriction endonuclease subunit S [Thiobacillus sp. SCUT-2]